MDGLPPFPDGERLRTALRFVPESLRADAVQVAWVAYLSGENVNAPTDEDERRVARAVDAWRRREHRRGVRELSVDPHANERLTDSDASGSRSGTSRRGVVAKRRVRRLRIRHD